MSTSSDYRKVTMMMENPSDDGFLDGRGGRRAHHRMKPFVLVSLLLLAVVGVAVALAVVLTANKTSLDAPEAVTILGSLHISNREYQASYADKGTGEFAAFEKEVKDAMDRVYNKSVFQNIYVGTSVSDIRKGSVVVDFAIHLEIPQTLFDLRQGEPIVSPPEYNEAYVHLVKAIDANQVGDFIIIEFSLSFDSESLSFDAITMPPVSKTVGQTDQLAPTLPSSPLPKDACNDNPCTNGGTCLLQPDTAPYFACRCPEGRGGYICQNLAASNPCDSNPCQHGGQCWSGTVEGQERYTCICPPDYDGQNCENHKLPRNLDGREPTDLSTGYGSSECIDIPILQCCLFLPYNQTVSPNPFGLAASQGELHEFFELSYHFLTPSCHPDAQRVLCTVLNPKCPGQWTAGYGAEDQASSVLDFQLPCRSVCREVHDSCLANLPQQLRREFEVFGNFCYSLPESGQESVCFHSSLQENAYEEPLGCQSSPCENGGACLELNGLIRCRCPLGYGGQTCAYELPNPCSPTPCLNGGVCRVSQGSPVPRFACECPAPYLPPHCDSGQ